MNISSIRLKQTLSARVASTGIQSSIPIGGSSTTALTPVNADIAYGFSMTSGHVNNLVKWTLDTHKLEFGDPAVADSTGLTCTESIADYSATPGADGDSIVDANGEAIPTAQCAVAIYYEIPADTATDNWVQASALSADATSKFCNVKLIGNVATAEQSGVRSMLVVSRQSCASDYVTFTFNAVGVKINVIYLANTTFV